MKTKTIALKLNYTHIKYDCFRPTTYAKEWFVEFHGGTNESYEGYMIKIRLSDLDYFFSNLRQKVKEEEIRYENIAEIYDAMTDTN